MHVFTPSPWVTFLHVFYKFLQSDFCEAGGGETEKEQWDKPALSGLFLTHSHTLFTNKLALVFFFPPVLHPLLGFYT